jgi:hypothetical protein
LPDYYTVVNRPNLGAADEFEAASKAVNTPLDSGDVVYVKLLDSTGSYNLVPGGVISVGGITPVEVTGGGVASAPLQFSVAGTELVGAVTTGYQIPVTTTRLSSGYVLVAGGMFSSSTISNLAFDGQSLSVVDQYAWPSDPTPRCRSMVHMGQNRRAPRPLYGHRHPGLFHGQRGLSRWRWVLRRPAGGAHPRNRHQRDSLLNITSAANELAVAFFAG